MIAFVILLCVILLCVKLTRCIIFNLHNVAIYSVRDLIEYIRKRKWKDFHAYGIDMFVGMFGKGKTLSMVHRARSLYKKYGDTLVFYSNFKLEDIPYIPPVSYTHLTLPTILLV